MKVNWTYVSICKPPVALGVETTDVDFLGQFKGKKKTQKLNQIDWLKFNIWAYRHILQAKF